MQPLALLAVLLMVCAPPLSRWVQAHGPLSAPAAAGSARPATAATNPAGMPGDAPIDMAMDMTGEVAVPTMSAGMHRHGAGTAMPAATDATAGTTLPSGHRHGPGARDGEDHAAHGAACDYCVLAARLLPALAIAWLLLPPLPPPLPRVRRRLPFFVPVPRRAHAPRGPPPAA